MGKRESISKVYRMFSRHRVRLGTERLVAIDNGVLSTMDSTAVMATPSKKWKKHDETGMCFLL